VIVIVAAAMGAILVMVALVLDLSGARRDRDADQTAADAMALAAAGGLGGARSSAQPACEAAWAYLVVNLPTAETAPAPSCAVFASACVPTTAREVVSTVGAYRVTITHPVPVGHALLQGQPPGPNDGTACDRIGVRVEQSRTNLWAAGSVELDVQAVARFVPGSGKVSAPLVLLSEHGCSVLTISGNGALDVLAPGHVAIDSTGQECNNPNKVVLDVDYDNDGVAAVKAAGIAMWALRGPYAVNAYKPGLLSPMPFASSAPIGRDVVDRRYNCDPAMGCPEPGPPHIDRMVAAWGGPGAPAEWAAAPAPFTAWSPTRSCAPTGDTVVPAGNWYINCGTDGLSTGGTLTFRGGNIVSEGPIKLTGAGKLRINCSPMAADPSACTEDPAAPSVLFLRSGDLLDSGILELRETMVYLHTGTADVGGNRAVSWTAPKDPAHPFDDLMLWANQSTNIKITGGASVRLGGLFFAPNATVELVGGSGSSAVSAQIFASKAKLSGNGALILDPGADTTLTVGEGRPLLIR
jgi:hypothetical protein